MKILTVDGIAREVMWSLKRWRDATLKTDEDSDDDQIIIDDDEDEEHVDAEDLDDNNFPRSAAMSDPRLKELHKYSACDVSLFFSLYLSCSFVLPEYFGLKKKTMYACICHVYISKISYAGV